MPQRSDIKKILIIGSGPIVIGQGPEFDYSGVQACKALKSAGYEIVLVNSNPATIMTDPQMADHTYIEPLTLPSITNIIKKERPDALLSTMGGQTALNCALELEANGVLAKYNVELIGANKTAINKAEDRGLFRQAMEKLGLESARSFITHNMQEALLAQQQLDFPVIIRPSFTLGGSGGGIAYNQEQFTHICQHGFNLSLNSQVLIEESLLGWKEYELEVIRDLNDNCIVVCTIENIDPMGVHTGDSITVAPAQTLTDKEYQIMRNAAFAILREIGVETGGANVQFAVNPQNGRLIVVEMNPRVSRSSALASKATGFPIAKVAALLAVGFTLDELRNDITGGLIPASFEPTLDYVVVKIPRFNFDKMPGCSGILTTQMQSVGEVMAIGNTFTVALQKAYSGLEARLDGLNAQVDITQPNASEIIKQQLRMAGQNRLLYVADALRAGYSIEEIHALTAIDPWFIDQIGNIIALEHDVADAEYAHVSAEQLLYWKQQGLTDARLATLLQVTVADIRALRNKYSINPKFRHIDSCAAEFPASTSYLYSTYIGECEAHETERKNKPKVIVLGSGPNRIGQGIEFDYSCVKAIQCLQTLGLEAIMINCNPETVSTDYDISDRLYFEPLTLEMVLEIVMLEKPLGVILQLGGQTPLKLAKALEANGVTILGSSPATIDLAEDRAQFSNVINKLGLLQPDHVLTMTLEAGMQAAESLGFPLILRPSYVLGGRGMQVVHTREELSTYLDKAFAESHDSPVLIDRFLQNATEVDVDLVADGHGGVFVAGMLEHIEPAGVHSGDSAMSLPPHTLPQAIQSRITAQAIKLAKELNVIGLMNIQFAVQGTNIYIIEVNPRASRTVPFVSKARGIPVIDLAVQCMLGKNLAQLEIPDFAFNGYAIKQSVFPFIKFAGVDPMCGPEMRSTGEIMAIDSDFFAAFKKSISASGGKNLTAGGNAYISVDAIDAEEGINVARQLLAKSFKLLSCSGTADLLANAGLPVELAADVACIASNDLTLVICSKKGTQASAVRQAALRNRKIFITNLAVAKLAITAIDKESSDEIYKLQTLHVQQELELMVE